MSHFNQISTNINILTKGWFVRSFILLLWLIATVSSFLLDESKLHIALLLIGFSNAFMYMLVAGRLPLLAHYSLNKVLPRYFSNLKQSLAVIFLVSLIPTLILLPHFSQWLVLITICLAMAILFTAMTYQPKFYWIFIVLMFMPFSLQQLSIPLPDNKVDLQGIAPYFAPLFAWWAYYLLNKLETFQGDKKHIARVVAMTSLNMNRSIVSADNIPLKSRNRAWQWLIKSNFQYYRELIKNNMSLSNGKLIEIACQSSASVGRFTYSFWTLAVVCFVIIGSLFSEQKQNFLIPTMIMFPIMILGAGTLIFFQVVNNKKSLLQRLAILPAFHGKQGFAKCFLMFVITNQLKLYSFFSLVVMLFAYTFHSITMATYFNIVLSSIILCILSLVIMLWSWSSKDGQENVSLWLMLILFISFMVFLFIVIAEEGIALYQSSGFLTFFSLSFLLLVIAVYQSLRHIPQRFSSLS